MLKNNHHVNKDQILFFTLTELKNKCTAEDRSPAFKYHFCVFPIVVFEDRVDCMWPTFIKDK